MKKVKKLSDEFWKKINEKYPYISHVVFNSRNPHMFLNKDENKFFMDCRAEFTKQFYEESFYKDLKKDAEKIASDLEKALKIKGYEIRSLRYEDDSDDGFFMEKGFMPFLASNPERNYEIIATSNH